MDFFLAQKERLLTPSPSPKERVAKSSFWGVEKTNFRTQDCNEVLEIAPEKLFLFEIHKTNIR